MLDFGFKKAFNLKGQTSIFLVGLGHGAVHWVYMVFTVLTPWIKQSYDLSYTEVGLLHAIFHIASFSANAGSGVLVDLTGKKVIFQIIAVLSGGVAIMVCGLGSGFVLLLAMMAVIGISNNLWHPAAFAFLSKEYPKHKGYTLSVHALGASLGDIMAPLVAVSFLVGVLQLDWQSAAVSSSVPVLFVGLALTLVVLPKDRRRVGDENTRGMKMQEYFSGLAALLKNKAILGLSLMAAFRTSSLFCIFFALPLYLVEVLALTKETQGLAMAMMQVGGLVTGPLAGTLSDKIGRRSIVMYGLSAVTIVIIGLTFVGDSLTFVVGITILGFVLYAIRPVVQAWMMDLAPSIHGGSAASVMFAMQSAWTPFVVLLSGFIADSFGLLFVFYLVAASMLCANIVAYFLPKGEMTSDL